MRYRFGEFELDVTSYALRRGARELQVTPKVFDVLRYLLEHRSRVVSKQELLDAVWAGRMVSEVAVPWTVSHVRRALGQRGSDKRPIETIHGRGYRFVGEVEELRAGREPPRVAASPEPASSPSPPPESPFVGREQAMAALGARLAAVRTGSGGLCALVGAAGIGKTRCMHELAALARAQGFAVWSGRSTEDTVAPVFWPWMQLLRELARDRPQLREACHALLARLSAIEPAHHAAELPDDKSAASFWLFDGVSGLLRAAAREGPSLILLDDLHWADAGSLQLLSFVAPELQHNALLVLTAQRDGRAARRPHELRRLSRHAERIELDPLTAGEIDRYLRTIARTGAPAAELCQALHRATAGNPLFLQQTVRGLIARHGRDALGSLAPELIEPTASARDVLRSRFDALGDPARRVLEVASVLGEEFAVSMLRELTELDAETLLVALAAAADEGVVVAQQPNQFRFGHALLRSALYEDLAADDRVRLHRRAAALLEQSAPARSRTSEVAHHYYRSLALGDYARVAGAAEQAARAAARVGAYSDAAMFCHWAREAYELDPEARPRARAELLLLCARLERLAGNREQVQRTVASLIELARHHGYMDLLVRAARVLRPSRMLGAFGDPQVCALLEEVLRNVADGANEARIGALSQLSWTPPHALDMEHSKALSGQALSLARQLGEPTPLLHALHSQLYALSGPDDIAAVLDVADEMLRRDDGVRPGWVTMEALSARHAAFVQRGDLLESDAALAAFGRIAREEKWNEPLWAHDRIGAQRRLLAGDFAAADAACEPLRARAKRLRLYYGALLVDLMHAVVTAMRDGPVAAASRWDAAEPWTGEGDVRSSLLPGLLRMRLGTGRSAPAKRVLEGTVGEHGVELPKEIGFLNAAANLALFAIEIGDLSRAERLYEELAPYPHHNTPNSLMYYDGSVSHFLAMLAVFTKRDERAAHHFDDALAMNERLELRPQLAQTCYEYARYLLARGRTARPSGLDLRARAIDLSHGLGMSWLAALAHALD